MAILRHKSIDLCWSAITCHDHRHGREPSLAIAGDNWPDGELRAIPFGPLVNSDSQSNFSRSHEHATHRSTCTRHSKDAAVPVSYLTRISAPTYAEAYAALVWIDRYRHFWVTPGTARRTSACGTQETVEHFISRQYLTGS